MVSNEAIQPRSLRSRSGSIDLNGMGLIVGGNMSDANELLTVRTELEGERGGCKRALGRTAAEDAVQLYRSG